MGVDHATMDEDGKLVQKAMTRNRSEGLLSARKDDQHTTDH
jgi:hypothetical protein